MNFAPAVLEKIYVGLDAKVFESWPGGTCATTTCARARTHTHMHIHTGEGRGGPALQPLARAHTHTHTCTCTYTQVKAGGDLGYNLYKCGIAKVLMCC